MPRAVWLLAVAIAACSAPADRALDAVVYAAPAPLWPQPPTVAQLGAGPSLQPLIGTAIVARFGVATAPLSMTAMVASSDGSADAAVTGRVPGGIAIDMIDVDAGSLRWRNVSAAMPAVAIAGSWVFAAEGERIVVLDRRDGREVQRIAGRFTIAGRDGAGRGRALIAVGDRIALLDGQGAGPNLSLPADAAVDDVVALCADARGDYALAWRAGALQRWDLRGDAASAVWTAAVTAVARIDCERRPIVVVGANVALAIDPDTGAIVGGPAVATDAWLGDGDTVVIATDAGLETWDRRLVAVRAVRPIAVEQWIAGHDGRHLWRGHDGSNILVDAEHAIALAAPGGQPQVALGSAALVAGPWRFPWTSQHQQPTRYQLPGRAGVAERRLDTAGAIDLPIDLPRVDLPAAQTPAPAITADAGAWAVASLAFDPGDHEALYTTVLDERPTATRGAGVARFDLHADRWRWVVRDACPAGQPIALAVVGAVVVCAAHGAVEGAGAVRAVRASDGARAWDWHGATVDAMVAAGSVVVLTVGAEVIVLDAATGRGLASWRTSDGFLARVAVIAAGADTQIASYEHGAIVVRSRALAMMPIASTAVAGTLLGLAAIDRRVVATMADGSAYLVSPDGTAIAVGALARLWRVRGDRVLALAHGPLGDATVTAVDDTGIPRVQAAIPAAELVAIGVRSSDAMAPIAINARDGRAIVLDASGVARAVVALADPTAALFATVVDGQPSAGAILATPLRLVHFRLR